ncbi:MAG: leucine-rich repeat protein [Verrucomicrobiales bacterium]|nr:leucine-rich repeat protein [Verrucomicrobiales bacterium]
MKFPSSLILWIALLMSSGKLMSADLSDLSYSVKYGSVIITDCKTTAAGELEIPALIGEVPVTKIGSAAFRGCSNLTSIVIPDGVTTIGDESFYSCSLLAAITVPDGVISIGESAFRYCNSLTSINLPEGITSIGDSAFHNCGSLSDILIPSTVTQIGERAFRDCKNLARIVIPAGVSSVERLAFYGCTSLRQVHIDGELPAFGSNVFGGSANSYITYSGDQTMVAGRPSFSPSQLFEVNNLRETIKVKDAQIAQLATRPSVQEIQDARAGSIIMRKDEETGKAKLQFRIEQTDNFESWDPYEGGELSVSDDGGFELLLPLDADKIWLRVGMDGEAPESFDSGREGGDLGGIDFGDLLNGGGFPGVDIGGDNKEGDKVEDKDSEGEGDGEGDGEGENSGGLGNINLGDLNLDGIDLENINLEDLNLEGVNLEDLNLGGLDLGNLNLGDLNLEGLNLDEIEINPLQLVQLALLFNQFLSDVSDVIGVDLTSIFQSGAGGEDGEGGDGVVVDPGPDPDGGDNGGDIDLGDIDLGGLDQLFNGISILPEAGAE